MIHRIAIIGAGAVGSAAAYALSIKHAAAEILLIDANEQKEQGEAMDLSDVRCFVETGCIKAADFRDAGSANILIVTAGAAQKPGETRLDLIEKNTAIVADIFKRIGKINREAVVLMVTNPVDLMTMVALRASGLPARQVFGSGTTLDTARLKHLLGDALDVSPQNIHGYVLGEHGDSEFVAWSTVEVGGLPIAKVPGASRALMREIEEQVKKQAYEIINRKGMTNYGIGLSVANIVEAILYNQHLVLPVTSLLESWNGVSGICLGAPAVVGHAGVERVWPLTLPAGERKKLLHSAAVIRQYIS